MILPRPLVFALALGLSAAPVLVAAPNPTPSTSPGIDLSGIDRGVRPGQDFFAHANGAWLKATEIPADRAAYGVGGMVTELTNRRTAELIQQTEKTSAPKGSVAQKVGDYYASYMDEAAIEAKGLAPLRPVLDRVAAIQDRQALARVLGSGLRADVDALNNTDL